jgi:Zn-dependent protease with chaperone function
MLRAFVAQSILHALVAGLVVEALLRAWRVQDGGSRLRLRLLALAEPIVALPVFMLVPGRATPAFADGWALFATSRWDAVRVGDSGLGDLILAVAAGLGAALFLRDAAPALLDAARPTAAAPQPLALPVVPAALAALVARHAAALGIAAPGVRVLRSRLPVLLCEGARRPALVISVAAIERLDPAALDAAVAHEVVHAARRDPLWGYVLIAARALTFYNPAAQWIARAAVDEIERRADQAAVRLTGSPDALARAIRLLALTARPALSGVGDRFERLFWQGRVQGVTRRVARLFDRNGHARDDLDTLHLALTAVGLSALLFFVV